MSECLGQCCDKWICDIVYVMTGQKTIKDTGEDYICNTV
jgi:hypothetical protein